jgi:hypothetical protein
LPATVQIVRTTGSGTGTETVITNLNTRVLADDSATVAGTQNPVQIPTVGSNPSFWVSTRLSGSTNPATVINNIRWFTSGSSSLGTGIVISGSQATGSYAQATGLVGTSGSTLSTAGYSGIQLTGSSGVLTQFTSSTPYFMSGSFANGAAPADFGGFMVFQIWVGSTANPGATGQDQFSFRYDET